jgi:hypothetical protein
MMNKSDMGQQFLDAIMGPMKALGIDLGGAIKQEAAASMARLATLVGQPGYEMAVEAERDIVLAKAGIQLAKAADSADAKALGLIEGALSMGASFLTGGAI